MAFVDIPNISIRGISACVPKKTENVCDYKNFSKEDALKFTETTGVISRHIEETGKTTSDFCFKATMELLESLNWKENISDIEILIFVSQTRDYVLPSTSCILQNRIGLSKECITMDIPYGCSGYIYGLNVISSIMTLGKLKRGLLLVGDVVLPHHNYNDKSSYPLFGDAGTCTALEYDTTSSNMSFHFATDGSGSDAIIIPAGGYRHRTKETSFNLYDYNGGQISDLDCHLDGMSVFSFGISAVPKSIKKLMERNSIKSSEIDYLVLHQANMSMNEIIRKKTGFTIDQTPYSIEYYGNTSCSTIPITMIDKLSDQLNSKRNKILISGFGVGLSWGSAIIETNRIKCIPIINL